MKRGVIGSPGIIRRLADGFTMERSISAEELRFYVLYWDHVAIPGNNLVYIGVPEEEELIECGAISRPRVQYAGSFSGGQVTDAILACQSVVANEYAKDQSIDWALHQFGGDMLLPPLMSKETDVFRLAVASVLPVPPAILPVAEVLEFKERKKSDLKALHDCLDELYFDILRTPDVSLGSRKLLADFKEEIAALGRDKKDTSAWRRFDLSVEFNVRPKDVIVGLAAGAALDLSAGLAIPVATVAGAVASLLEFKVSKTRTVGEASSNRLGYLSSAKAEGILR